MKKILALTLTGILLFGGSAAVSSAFAENDNLPATRTEAAETERHSLYLVPGTYASEGEKTENTVGEGATKLSEEQCAQIFTENAYICSLGEGAALPVPVSNRVDKDGNAYTFNGWWTIRDATVTYFDKVPALTQTTYLYADWRADLSQRRDPVEVDDSTKLKPLNYMSVTRAATGETEIIALRVSGADVPDVETLGYGAPVQLYNGYFELNPNDVITVYATGLGESSEPQAVPFGDGRSVTLENSDENGNSTANYLTVSDNSVLTYRRTQKKRHYRIYIKFKSGGSKMLVYMEPMN